MTYHWICNINNTTGVTSGTGTANSSEAHGFKTGVNRIFFIQSLVLCGVFCRELFVFLFFILTIVLSVLLWLLVTYLVSLNLSYTVNDLVYYISDLIFIADHE